jgi:polysaccharide pyruvyl transferase WcaK-like protein
MRILLTGYYGFGNFGDDLLLVCAHSATRERFPDAELVVFANYSEHLGAHVDPSFRHYLHRLVPPTTPLIDWTARERFDLVVHGGGGVFFDDRPGRLRDAALNAVVAGVGARGYRRLAGAARALLGRPPRVTADRRVGLGIGLGPYVASGRRLWREAEVLGSFSRLAVRDPGSHQWAVKLGLGGCCRQFTDLAFGVDRWLGPARPRAAAGDVVGVVLCDGKRGNADILEAVAAGRLAGQPVRFIFLDGVHDARLIERIRASGHDVVVWDPRVHPLRSFVDELAACSLLVSNRAHGAIVGACVGVPSICIGADAKLRSVHGMIPTGTRLLEVEALSSLPELASAMLRGLPGLRRGLAADVAARRAEVSEMTAYALA